MENIWTDTTKLDKLISAEAWCQLVVSSTHWVTGRKYKIEDLLIHQLDKAQSINIEYG